MTADNLTIALAALFFALFVGSIIRCVLIGQLPVGKRRDYLGSLLVWWVLAGLTLAICWWGRPAAALLLGLVSLLGLREYLAMTESWRGHRLADRWAYGAVTLHYLFILLDWSLWAAIFLPIFTMLALCVRMILTSQMSGFVRDVSMLLFGIMLIGYCPSHAAMLFVMFSESPAEIAGWFFFLVVLTELNDIAQALWGRQFGKHKIIPHVSPGKTWEGFLLGLATTLAVAVLLAPLLVALPPARLGQFPLNEIWRTRLVAAVAGLIIATSGFFGDLTMSAVKHDAGTKDSGHLLPGQGGILDRMDSLSFTAPLFFYYARFLYGD